MAETLGAAPVRVLIVDDQPLVRGGFRMLVDSQPDLTVVGDLDDGVAAVEAVRTAAPEQCPDVILMDVRMPRMDGIAATREILRRRPEVRIIVLTTFDLDEYALEGIQAGASGFLLKDARPEELLDAIRTVAQGEALNNVEWASAVDGDRAFADAQLSSREREVLRLYATGLPLKAVAERLGVAYSTAKENITRIRVKYVEVGRPAPTKVDLLRRAMEDGIVTADGAPSAR
ncbi:MAG TPA: LuxR family transcriptional regulator [Kocuria sp.]|nr:LuxR family transcriptional regulator [Kocuria sp.]